ncbi:xanthine dehydrogenase FAD-binding subunit XdhB [Treponema sp.]
MVNEYFKASSLEDALGLLEAKPGANLLAGGTFFMAGYLRGSGPTSPAKTRLDIVIDIGPLLSRKISKEDGRLCIGAGVSFQELAESAEVPVQLRNAALTMANRNTRNRATVGGNLGANKSCASLIPFFLAADARVAVQRKDEKQTEMALAKWLSEPKGIVLNLSFPLEPGMLAATLRSSRTACDVATSTAAVAYRLEGTTIRDLRIALGGFGPHARRWPELEALFEGKSLASKADIEKMASGFLLVAADQRGSEDYKRHRGATLLSDALHAVEVLA